MLTEIGPPLWQAKADKRADIVSFACHGSGLNSVNHGEILLEYDTYSLFEDSLPDSKFIFFRKWVVYGLEHKLEISSHHGYNITI